MIRHVQDRINKYHEEKWEYSPTQPTISYTSELDIPTSFCVGHWLKLHETHDFYIFLLSLYFNTYYIY